MNQLNANELWTEDDKIHSEEYIETSLGYLHHEGSKSPDKIARHKKVILRELEFLRENFPSSYVLVPGYVDVDLS